jgi:hypothetical protein
MAIFYAFGDALVNREEMEFKSEKGEMEKFIIQVSKNNSKAKNEFSSRIATPDNCGEIGPLENL